MIKVLNIDAAMQRAAYVFYKRVQVAHAHEYVTFPLDYGFNFLLGELRAKWPDRDAVPPTMTYPQPLIEIVEVVRTRPHQARPYPLRLATTPAESGVLVTAAPLPVDATAYNVNMTATPPKLTPALNYYFASGSVVQIRLSGQQFIAGVWRPEYVDLVLNGVYIPDEALDVWKQLTY